MSSHIDHYYQLDNLVSSFSQYKIILLFNILTIFSWLEVLMVFIDVNVNAFILTWKKIDVIWHIHVQRLPLLKLLLLLLSGFSHALLCATPYTAAHQAHLSLGFSSKEHWSGLPFPSPMHESEKWKGSRLVVSDS